MSRQLISLTRTPFNAESDLIAFIDEAGDEGFNPRSARWLVVSGIAFRMAEYQRARQALQDYADSLNKEIKNFSFKNLSHNRRKDWSYKLGRLEYTTVHSAFYKAQMTDDEKRMAAYPSMYYWGVKNVMERLSWHTKQHSANKIHIMVGKRNNLDSATIKNYLFKTSVNANRNMIYMDRLGTVVPGSVEDIGIHIADTIASSMFQALEPSGDAQLTEESYYHLCIREHLYNSNHARFNGVWRNGFKCTPDNPSLVNISGISTGGTSS